MKAVRLQDCLDIDSADLSTQFEHINHMYTGRLSRYYYRRFDQVLELVNWSQTEDVLIVGGGTGVFALTVASLVDRVCFSDVERETPMFDTPRTLFRLSDIDDAPVRYVAADASDLPFTTDSFDVVFALDVLEHVPDERTAIAEISRVTNSAGKPIISAPIEVGPAVLVREAYRFIDGQRRLTKSMSELLRAALYDPALKTNEGHRGYDYRQTMKWLNEEFDDTSTTYCPLPFAYWANPTAIMSARHLS